MNFILKSKFYIHNLFRLSNDFLFSFPIVFILFFNFFSTSIVYNKYVYFSYSFIYMFNFLLSFHAQIFSVHTHDNNNYCLYYAPVHVLLFYLSEFCHLAKLADICLRVELTTAAARSQTPTSGPGVHESSWTALAVIAHTSTDILQPVRLLSVILSLVFLLALALLIFFSARPTSP